MEVIVNYAAASEVGLGSARIDGFVFGIADAQRDELAHTLHTVVDFVEVDTPAELLEFVTTSEKGNCVIGLGDYVEPEVFAALAMIAINRGDTDILLLGPSGAVSVPQEQRSHPRIHTVTGSRETRHHHLKNVAAQLQSRWLNSVLRDIVVAYDEMFPSSEEYRARASEYAARVRKITHAEAVGVFILRPTAGYYLPIIADGALIPLPAADTSGDMESLLTMLRATDGFARLQWAVAPFLVHGIPGFVFVSFEEAFPEQVIRSICTVSAREMVHLYRAQSVRTEYDTLRQITELQNLTEDKDLAVEELLNILQKHFNADGVSWLELIDRDGDKLKLEKSFVHFRRHAKKLPITLDKGLTHRAITSGNACVAARFSWDGAGHPFAHGMEFELNDLTAGHGTKLVLETLEVPGTYENELSMAVVPVHRGTDLIGVLKLGSLSREGAFDLQDVQQLRVLSEPVAALMGNVQNVQKLRRQLGGKDPTQLSQYAETLFFYREVALRNFHQVTNYVGDIANEVLLAEALVEDIPTASPELTTLLVAARRKADAAKSLIEKAQLRGRSLRPLDKICRLLDEVVRPAVLYATEKAGRRKAHLVRVLHSLTTFEYLVRIDPDLLYEGLLNIVNNGLWAMWEYKNARKRDLFIAVREYDVGRRVRVEIDDTGIGITPDSFQRLFQPFFTTKGSDGTGLGLYSTRRLVEQFSGTLDVERSAPGQGTRVVLTLPLVRKI
jgi:signal transduction histidine kinase